MRRSSSLFSSIRCAAPVTLMVTVGGFGIHSVSMSTTVSKSALSQTHANFAIGRSGDRVVNSTSPKLAGHSVPFDPPVESSYMCSPSFEINSSFVGSFSSFEAAVGAMPAGPSF